MVFWFAFFVIVAVVWGAIGYRKGAPHGLGAAGAGYGMLGLYGMKKLNERIAQQK